MTAGLFVWAGGRWRALDAAAGRVAGWRRRPRFVYRARGRLQLASSAAVLRGLRALLAGKASSVRDGAPLSQRRKARARCSACAHRRHCCSLSHEDGCTNNNKMPSIKVISNEPAPTTTEAGIQVTLSSQGGAVAAKEHPPRPSPQPLRKRKRSSSSEPQTITKKIFADVHRHSSDGDTTTRRQADEPSQKSSQKDHFKELIINEEDVDTYRSYLIANDPTFDVCRFDSDEEYKLLVFFRINPLVNIERCVRVERLLRASQSSQEMSLKDFATKLGLRSVSDHDSDVQRRYKMRRRMEKVAAEGTSDETDKENQVGSEQKDVYTSKYFDAKKKSVLEERKDKEKDNHVQSRTRNNIYSSLLKARGKLTPVDSRTLESSDQESNKGGREKEGAKLKVAKKVVSDSGSDFVNEQRPKKKPQSVKKFPIQFALPPSQKRVRSLVPYSSLEDHAIVAWVSTGSRARLVNGNRVWRELQPQYLSLTGQGRTWHSLRNRYLRYILPALGRLALPPPQAARLRAAAAAGELKSKNVSRRNSMFARPPRSAFAAAPAPRDEASDSDSRSPQRVLRSSGVRSPTERDQRETRDNPERSDQHERSDKHVQNDKRTEHNIQEKRDERDQRQTSEDREQSDRRDQQNTRNARSKRDKSGQRDKRDRQEKRDKRDQNDKQEHETRDRVDQRDKRDHKNKRDSRDKRNHSDTREKRDKRAQQEKRDQSNDHDQSDKRVQRDKHNRSDKRDHNEKRNKRDQDGTSDKRDASNHGNNSNRSKKRDRSAPARNRHGRFVRGHNYTSERLAKLNTSHAKLDERRGKKNDSHAKLNNAKSRERRSKSLNRDSISSDKSDSDSKAKKETSQVRKTRSKQSKRRSKSLDQESISSVHSGSTDQSKNKARKTRAKLSESRAKLSESRAKMREKRDKSLEEESSSVSSESTDRGESRRRSQARKSRANLQSDDEQLSDTSDGSEVSSVPPRDTRASLRDRSIKIRDGSEDSVPESRDKRTSLRDKLHKGRELRDSSEENSDDSGKPKRRDKSNKSNRSRDRRDLSQSNKDASLRDKSDRSNRTRDNANDSRKSNKNSSLRDRVRQPREMSKERDRRSKRRASLSSDEDFQTKRVSRTPTYEQLTRQFTARLRSTPNDDKSPATKSQATKSQRTRKLYNPNAPTALLR